MKDFVRKLNINIKYNTKIGNIKQRDSRDGLFHVFDQHKNEYTCTRIIVATGIDKPNDLDDEGNTRSRYEGCSVYGNVLISRLAADY